MNIKYNYKVVLEIADNLNDEEREYIEKEIAYEANRFGVEQHEDGAWYKKGAFTGKNDFGAVTSFMYFMEKNKPCFNKLEWHSLTDGGIEKAV